ncbi:50S ribosomal protein L29 [bacterium]|nr:50S ribosomal protein L29 [bacterium]
MEKEIKILRDKTIEDLKKALKEAKKRLEALRLDLAQAKTTKVHEVKKERKTISRVLTLLREKEWAEFEKGKGEKNGK